MSVTTTPFSTGFPPIIAPGARCLILGSMPSVASLSAHHYYAHPRNAFWPIMASLCGFDVALDYEARCQQLQQHHIAVWDVLHTCQRQGSLDSAIEAKSMTYNNIQALLQHYPNIEFVFLNGGKAASLFKTLANTQQLHHLRAIQLPSTSPAHAAISFSDKLAIWRAAFNPLFV